MRIKEGKFCKRIRQDLWGNLAEKGKFNKLFYYFHLLRAEYKKRKYVGLQFDEKKVVGRKRRLTKYGKLILSRKKICNFYGCLKLKDYKNFCLLAEKSNKSSFANNLASILERRLATIVYRMFFVASIFEGVNKIKSGYFLVNKKLIIDPNYLIKVGDIVEVIDMYKENIYYNMVDRAYYNWFITSLPVYLIVNFKLLMGCLLKEPTLNVIMYPFIRLKKNYYRKMKMMRRRLHMNTRLGMRINLQTGTGIKAKTKVITKIKTRMRTKSNLKARVFHYERGFFIDGFINRKF